MRLTLRLPTRACQYQESSSYVGRLFLETTALKDGASFPKIVGLETQPRPAILGSLAEVSPCDDAVRSKVHHAIELYAHNFNLTVFSGCQNKIYKAHRPSSTFLKDGQVADFPPEN